MFTDLQVGVCYDANMQGLGILRMRDIGYNTQVSGSPLADAHTDGSQKV